MTQKSYMPNIPEIDKKRIVIIGGGFAGLKFVQKSLCCISELVVELFYLRPVAASADKTETEITAERISNFF